MGEKKNAFKVWVGISEGIRPPSRLKCREGIIFK
jgi:hypothetical protein